MRNGTAESLLGALGRGETPKLEVDAPQTAGRRRSDDKKKMQRGEGVTDWRSREGEREEGVGWGVF